MRVEPPTIHNFHKTSLFVFLQSQWKKSFDSFFSFNLFPFLYSPPHYTYFSCLHKSIAILLRCHGTNKKIYKGRSWKEWWKRMFYGWVSRFNRFVHTLNSPFLLQTRPWFSILLRVAMMRWELSYYIIQREIKTIWSDFFICLCWN